VCIAVAPAVGVLLGWLALKETHPVTGTRGGRELATVALWVNVGITALFVVLLGGFLLQMAGSLAFMLPMIATSGV
jgi:hypothetical protein